MHLFAPNHVQLINACYPASQTALVNSGPEYKPNAQELSRLTYYAANRSGKITKLANELTKRVKGECRKAHAGNMRSRASLLITLTIFRALATECRRDITLLSAALVTAVDDTLSSLSSDLEVSARAASLFTAWTTYTDGHLIGADPNLTESYMSILKQLAQMSTVEETRTNDQEKRNRIVSTRLIGLNALTGAVTSEALYNAPSHFTHQVSTIIDAVMVTVLQSKLNDLQEQSSLLHHDDDKATAAYLTDFRSRPAYERRALSIHAHVDGQSGPTMRDVISASLRALSQLFAQSNGSQVGQLMQSAFNSLDARRGWEKADHCRWFAQRAADWTRYQYRYAVPTRLVERLLESQDVTDLTVQRSLAGMVTTVFTSPTPLVNLSTSDIVSNLITLVIRRISVDPDDPLVPDLVHCIAALGTHVYYADQIQDLAGELISRLLVVESNGVRTSRGVVGEKNRSQAIRALLAGLLGLMQAAHNSEKEHELEGGRPASPSGKDTTRRQSSDKHVKPSSRTRISPELWMDTLSLLCDGDYAVRADYARALAAYLRDEIDCQGDTTDKDGVRRMRPLADGPLRQASNITAVLYGDATTRFLSALHAYVYVLATSSTLGHNFTGSGSGSDRSSSAALSEEPEDAGAGSSAPSDSGASQRTRETQLTAHPRRSLTAPTRARKMDVAHRFIDALPTQLSSSPSSATASDYAHILDVLVAVQEKVPVRGLLTGVPMLVALDSFARVGEVADAMPLQKARAIKRIVATVCKSIGVVWDSHQLAELAEQALALLPKYPQLPEVESAPPGAFPAPREPARFSSVDGGLAADGVHGINMETVLVILASSAHVQDAVGLDEQGVFRRLAREWTPKMAVQDSFSATEQNAHSIRADGTAPLLKISPALMHIENLSLASLNRPTRGVGVNDLREALEGRSSISLVHGGGGAPSISTLDQGSSIMPNDPLALQLTRSRTKKTAARPLKGPGEVRDVLNKLGIGKQNGGGNGFLKTPFPGSQARDRPP
ncbi:hypothetical protein PUNSTDRAFT_112183 [Punctularia strigosozonata HHB-11173 SS5]|uniref:uncharacterized protein n=1 Tax=Punctularia strigosozonata (strain HHB-11173) TaxID=741275 RepID=UPI000441709B|nr:uncharacterized protein PUNSTDRAFT_112183 [Punctularia strigosozonata HHB-11173 SS5]EIN10313.1 hypothetical protein PUNSTDRAFT_112183 [Punctularia strigosozonata HHB-11173 SS5]